MVVAGWLTNSLGLTRPIALVSTGSSLSKQMISAIRLYMWITVIVLALLRGITNCLARPSSRLLIVTRASESSLSNAALIHALLVGMVKAPFDESPLSADGGFRATGKQLRYAPVRCPQPYYCENDFTRNLWVRSMIVSNIHLNCQSLHSFGSTKATLSFLLLCRRVWV